MSLRHSEAERYFYLRPSEADGLSLAVTPGETLEGENLEHRGRVCIFDAVWRCSDVLFLPRMRYAWVCCYVLCGLLFKA